MLQHPQNKFKGGVSFPFHLNSEKKTKPKRIAGEGLGLASVQDEKWVPVIPAESSPVPLLLNARLDQQFIFCILW